MMHKPHVVTACKLIKETILACSSGYGKSKDLILRTEIAKDLLVPHSQFIIKKNRRTVYRTLDWEGAVRKYNSIDA
jgi:hypothetical protein